jgi:hypothetical protein
MDRSELRGEVEALERELGPCILVAKCLEQLGDLDAAKSIAALIVGRETADLAEMGKRKLSFHHLAEQFLRVAYALTVAGQRQQAVVVLRSFRDLARRYRASGHVLRGDDALRLVTAHVLLQDRAAELEELIEPESFEGQLATAWSTGHAADLAPFVRQFARTVEEGEKTGHVSPSQDGWLYVLLRRLQAAVKAEG